MGVNKNLSADEMDESIEDLELDIDQIKRIKRKTRDEFGADHDAVEHAEELIELTREYNNADEEDNKFGLILRINHKTDVLRDVVEMAFANQ